MPKPWSDSSPSLSRLCANLHVHLGRAPDGRWAKIPASPDLEFPALLQFAQESKGLDVVGVVDMHIPSAQAWLAQAVARGDCVELTGGGYGFSSGLLLLLGCEVEVPGPLGPVHLLAYLPQLDTMARFGEYLSTRVTNP